MNVLLLFILFFFTVVGISVYQRSPDRMLLLCTQISRFMTRDAASCACPIPKLLHLTYHTKNLIPEKVYTNLDRFVSDFTVSIYDDNEGLMFIQQYFSSLVVAKYQILIGAHRADLLRYCLLYIRGGVYADIKTEFTQLLSHVLQSASAREKCILLVNSKHATGTIYNGFMAAPPRQCLFLRAINFIVRSPVTLVQEDYAAYIKNLYCLVTRDLISGYMEPGFNKGIKSNYFVYEEREAPVVACWDGLDRYGLCMFIYDNSKPVVKVRYADYPW